MRPFARNPGVAARKLLLLPGWWQTQEEHVPALFKRTPALKRKIIQLRNKGHNSPEIAERLHENVRFIEYLTTQLIAEGLVARSNKRRPRRTTVRQNQNIVALRTSKLSNRSIARASGLKLETLQARLRPLLKNGAVKRRGCGKVAILAARNLNFWHDSSHALFTWFVDKINNRVPYSIIARGLDCTAARVGQIRRLMVERYGEGVFAGARCNLSLPELARELGLSYQVAHKLCKDGLIGCVQREPGKRILITREACEAYKVSNAGRVSA